MGERGLIVGVDRGEYDTAVSLFFVSYIVLVSFVLFNVVVAVMLEEFMEASRRAKEEKQRLTANMAEGVECPPARGPLTRACGLS